MGIKGDGNMVVGLGMWGGGVDGREMVLKGVVEGGGNVDGVWVNIVFDNGVGLIID